MQFKVTAIHTLTKEYVVVGNGKNRKEVLTTDEVHFEATEPLFPGLDVPNLSTPRFKVLTRHDEFQVGDVLDVRWRA